jgi:DNA polymerase/3'-5' exonuclease PolX
MIADQKLIDHLQQIAQMFQKDKDHWRSAAFSKAAGVLRRVNPQFSIVDEQVTPKIDGVGSAINDVIVQFIKTGTSEKFQKLQKKFPVEALARLDAASCKKKVSQLLRPLTEARVDWGFAGSARRGLPTVKDVDVIVCLAGKDERKLIESILKNAHLKADVRDGDTKIGVTVPLNGRSFVLDLNFCSPENRGAYYLYFTGPKSFNVHQRHEAKVRGMRLNEKGLWKGTKLIAAKTEEEIFKALDEPYLQPYQRG